MKREKKQREGRLTEREKANRERERE